MYRNENYANTGIPLQIIALLSSTGKDKNPQIFNDGVRDKMYQNDNSRFKITYSSDQRNM